MNGILCATWQCLRRECIRGSAVKGALSTITADSRSVTGSIKLSKNSSPRVLPVVPIWSVTRALHSCIALRKPRFHRPDTPSLLEDGTANTDVIVHLSQRAAQSLFKGSLTREQADDLLSKIQRQRESGTLEDKIEGHSLKAVKTGLAYLRSRYPVDEEAAIIARIDNELDHEFRLPQTDVEFSRNEKSGLKEIQEDTIKREKREEERQQRAKAKKHSPRGQLELDRGPGGQVARIDEGMAVEKRRMKFKDLMDPDRKRKPPPEWYKKLHEDATDTEVPNMTVRQRLLPGAIFTIAVVMLSVWFADTYTPPSREARLFPDIPPAAACLQTIVVANIAVLLLWKVPQMWNLLNKYFMNLPIKPRPAQLFLATVSHQSVAHCLTNMALIWLIGVRLHDDIGRGPFLALFVAGGVLSSYTTLVVHTFKHLLFTATLGASGTVAAMLATSCVLHEGLSIRIPFFPGLDMSWLNTGVILAIIVLFEATRLRKGVLNVKTFDRTGFTVDHIGHFSGYIAGIGAGAYIRKQDPRWRDIERRSFWNRPGRRKVEGSDAQQSDGHTLTNKVQ